MKTIINIVLIVAVFFGKEIIAQNIYIGADLSVNGTGALYVSGNFTTNASANYSNDATVEIKGDISNDKVAMTQGSGITKLTGSATQTVGGTQAFIVNTIIVNNTSSGASNIIVNKNLIIGASANFMDGILISATDSITFMSASTYAGASDTSHISGLVEKIGNQAFTFPVGDGIKLRTAVIAAPSLASDVLTCKYFHSIPSDGAMGAGLDHVSTCELWEIKRTNGSSNPIVTLSYDNIYSGEITEIADLRVTNLIAGVWTDMGGPGVGMPAGMVKASVASSTWGGYTLGSASALNPLPIELLSFEAGFNNSNKGVDLKWETSSEKNSDYFTIEQSINGNEWVEISKLKAAGNSISVIIYKSFDPDPNNGINYYRLKETDFNGNYFYSDIEFVTINSDVSDISISPNPVATNTILNYWANNDEEFQLEITNALGQILMKKTVLLNSGDNQIKLEMEQFVPGNYFLKIQSSDFSKVQTKKIIKLN